MPVGGDFGFEDYARKQSLAALNGVAVILPEWYSLTRGGHINAAGIPQPDAAPASTPGAGVLTGEYIWVFTLYDENTDGEGPPSAALSVTMSGGKMTLDISAVTNLTANTRTTHWKVYRSQALASGVTAGILFFVAQVPIGTLTYEDNNSDATISVNDTVRVNEQAYQAPTQARTPSGFVVRHMSRLFAFGPKDYHVISDPFSNYGAWTPANRPDAWPDEMMDEIGDKQPIRGAVPMGDALMVAKENELWMWLYQDEPSRLFGDGRLENLGVGRGTCTHKTFLNVDGMIYSMDPKGIYEYRGGQSIFDMTDPINGYFERINWNEVAQFHGSYDDRHIAWFVALDDSTELNHAFVLDRQALQNNRGVFWWVYHFPMGIRDSSTFIQGPSVQAVDFGQAGHRFMAFMTQAGYELVFTNTYSDGVHPNLTKEGVTDGAATTTFEVTGANFVEDNATLAGCYVKFDHYSTPNPLLIESSEDTGTPSFTLASALSGTLPAGTAFKIGAIDCFWRSALMDAGDASEVKNFQYAHVMFEPTGVDGEFGIRFYNGRLNPVLAQEAKDESGWSVDVHGDVQVRTGGTYASGGRDGIVRIPMMGYDSRYIQVEVLHCGYTPFKFTGYQLAAQVKKAAV